MENLLAKNPDITVLHTINEPTAAARTTAIEAAGLQDQVTCRVGRRCCAGVQAVKDGKVGATAMQFPLLMASQGGRCGRTVRRTGTLPPPSEGLTFYNTGVVSSSPTSRSMASSPRTRPGAWTNCWGEKPAARQRPRSSDVGRNGVARSGPPRPTLRIRATQVAHRLGMTGDRAH